MIELYDGPAVRRISIARPVFLSIVFLAFLALFLLGASASAQAAPTRCEVLDHAKEWVDNGIMYSQGPGAPYCPGNLYCDPSAGGACYRPDCSGFVSAVWGLPAPGNTTYSFAGGPWDDGASYVIPFDDLLPGDALNFPGDFNAGTGHIRLFGGWLNDAHTRLWTYEESTCGTPAYYAEYNRSDFNSYVAIRLHGIRECGPTVHPTPQQISSNGAITAVNLDNQEAVEVWIKGQDEQLYHSWSSTNNDWANLEALGGGAACGIAAGYWPEAKYPEVFMPTSDGGSQHAWWSNSSNRWEGPSGFEGAGLKDFSTMTWTDGRLEIVARDEQGTLYNRHWRGEDGWSGWNEFSEAGKFATGASAINWKDGHLEVFATGQDGQIYNRWWRADENAWSDWTTSLGAQNIASRPVPIRHDNGIIEVFARGEDDYLYHAWHDGQWHEMRRLGDQKIQGEPSAVFNASNGGPAGPQVYARDTNGKLFEIHQENGQWLEFRALLDDRALASDPFAWIRGDGVGLLFAVDESGQLLQSQRDPGAGWQPWSTIDGAEIDGCLPAPAAPDEPDDPGESDTTEPPEDPADPGDDPAQNGDSNGDSTDEPDPPGADEEPGEAGPVDPPGSELPPDPDSAQPGGEESGDAPPAAGSDSPGQTGTENVMASTNSCATTSAQPQPSQLAIAALLLGGLLIRRRR